MFADVGRGMGSGDVLVDIWVANASVSLFFFSLLSISEQNVGAKSGLKDLLTPPALRVGQKLSIECRIIARKGVGLCLCLQSFRQTL